MFYSSISIHLQGLVLLKYDNTQFYDCFYLGDPIESQWNIWKTSDKNEYA